MKRIVLFMGLSLCTGSAALAQKENNVWVFGDRMGLDFNSGNPVTVQTAVRTLGGSASVCNAGGQLLFYTQGDTIWNRNHQIMPNGGALIAPYASNTNAQSAQGQLILPVIGNPDRYYVFSQETVTDYIFGGDPYASRLYYSVVDMSLNGGLGDVVPGMKKIALDSGLTSEKMVAVRGSNCNLWLLVHKADDATFKAYEITASGISANPVISVSGNMTGPLSYALGKMKVSPNGQRLVLSNWLLGAYGCELFDFNPATGVVSNPVVVDTLAENISACFSPDNSKLYLLNFDGGDGALYQLNLSLPTPAAIAASKTMLDTLKGPGTSVFDAKIGPDGKIYVKMPYSTTTVGKDTIGRISSPNAAGTACGYTHAAIISTQNIQLGNGDLPNEFVKPKQDTTYSSTTNTLPQGGSLTLQAPTGYHSYVWNTGETTSSKTVSASGTYWVTYSNYCSRKTDTFHVNPPLGIPTTAAANPVRLYPNPASGSVTIEIADPAHSRGQIRLLDMLGQTVATAVIDRRPLVLNTAQLAAGVYEVVYTDDQAAGASWHGRLVIRK